MERIEEAVRLRRFNVLPSSEDFVSTIEPTNAPAVFNGVAESWMAFSKWNPFNGGLDYLQEKVGSAIVEAMQSNSAPIFYGDIRSHERVPLPFSTFLDSCKFYLHNNPLEAAITNSGVQCSTSLDTPDQYYFAQVPIFSTENKEMCPLKMLIEDIQTPVFLGGKTLSSINLWLNRGPSRSSTHYDPHHNLLCVVAGRKQVVLWPPSASHTLYPMPIHGEASNHSAVDIKSPDLLIHSRAKHSKDYSQKIILHAGDALFIPEGWFHQVDSDHLTIGVNFWWKSNMMSNMLEHMDAYYLRRILNRLLNKEMVCMLHGSAVGSLKGSKNHEPSNEDSKCTGSYHPTKEAIEGYHESDSIEQKESMKANSEGHGLILDPLEPFALSVLHELVSLVHDTVIVGDRATKSTSIEDSGVNNPHNEQQQTVTDDLSLVEKDPIASAFWAVEPLVLQKVLLDMAHRFPRTLEALIVHMLSPAAAEVLTRKFDDMDQQATKEQQNEFYQQFYSVFEDQYAAMDAILHGKESFAFQAFQRVLDQYLGVTIEKPK